MPRFFKFQLAWFSTSMLIPAISLLFVLTGIPDPYIMSNIALPSVLSCWILSLAMPLIIGGEGSREMRYTAFILNWSVIAIMFPLSWDLSWAILHDWVNGATAQDLSKWFFWAYAVADTRFLNSDPVMIIVEYWSGFIALVEIYMLVHLFRNQTQKAYYLFVLAGFLQVYGCSVFFGTEAMNNFENIRPDFFSYLKFFGLNGMWVTTPFIAGFLYNRLLKTPGYQPKQTLKLLFGRH